jgi:hypothetical protein
MVQCMCYTSKFLAFTFQCMYYTSKGLAFTLYVSVQHTCKDLIHARVRCALHSLACTHIQMKQGKEHILDPKP